MPTITVDFETVSAVDLLAVGMHRYAEDPTTAVIVLDIRAEDGRTYEWDPSKPTDVLRKLALDPNVTWEAHNAGFEKAVWRKIMMADYGLPDIPNERWVCTMAACAYKAIPQALDNAAVTLRLGESKDAEGSKLTIGLSKMDKHGSMPEITPAILARVHEYCGQDNAVEAALGDRVGRLPPSEQAIWLMDQARNERGVQIDVAFAVAADKVVEEAKGPLLAEHAKLTGGLKPTQREKVMDWLGFSGLDLPDLQRETVADILGIDDDPEDVDGPARSPRPELPEDVRRVLEIRYLINSTSIAKLKTMLACVCADGRARGLFNYHGTGPGRSTSKLLQLQNFPRGTIKDPETGKAPDPEKLVQAIMTGSAAHVERAIGPAIECVSSALRHALIAKDGHVLMAGDYAGIQARVVLALAGQYDKVAVMAAGADIYCDMATSIYRRKITKEADPAERQVGKNCVLGLGFGMGAGKFHDKYGEGQELAFNEEVVRIYRKEWAPNVPRLWYGLMDAAALAVHTREAVQPFMWINRTKTYLPIVYQIEDGWLSCKLPSGRKIWYWNPQPTKEPVPWDADDIRLSFTYQATKQGRLKVIHAFGGLLCLRGDTEVLTNRGYVKLIEVRKQDKVHDGESWVSHDGLVHQGHKSVIDFGGVWMTPDHKVWQDGWKRAIDGDFNLAASSCEAVRRVSVREADRIRLPGNQPTRRSSLVVLVRVWRELREAASRPLRRLNKQLRMLHLAAEAKREAFFTNPWSVTASSLRSLAKYAGAMLQTFASSLGQLWRAGDRSVRQVGLVSGVLGRYGAELSERAIDRKGRQQWQLHARKLPMGDAIRSIEQPPYECVDQHAGRSNDDGERGQEVRLRSVSALVADQPGLGARTPVFDLLNAGSNRRFIVRGADGRDIIVSNCENVVMGIERDIMAAGELALEEAGFPTVMNIHDEVVCEVPELQFDVAKFNACMLQAQELDWVKQLRIPIAVETWPKPVKRYRK